jgi:hypothetical protein
MIECTLTTDGHGVTTRLPLKTRENHFRRITQERKTKKKNKHRASLPSLHTNEEKREIWSPKFPIKKKKIPSRKKIPKQKKKQKTRIHTMWDGYTTPATKGPTNERLAHELADTYTEEKLGLKVASTRIRWNRATYGGRIYSVNWRFRDIHDGEMHVDISMKCEYEVSVWMGQAGNLLLGYFHSDGRRPLLGNRIETAVSNLKAADARITFVKDLKAFLVSHAPKSKTPMKTISMNYDLLVPFVWNSMKVSSAVGDVLNQLKDVLDDSKLLETVFVDGLNDLRERAKKLRNEERQETEKRKRDPEEDPSRP